MAVMARDSWTDQRLDDLNQRVAALDRRMEAGFAGIREEFRATRAENAAARRTMLQVAAAIWVTALVGFLGVIATVITQG